MTPLFLLHNPVLLLKWDCLQKKPELNTLRFDQDIRILSLEKIEPKFSKIFVCGQKNSVNQQVFMILLIFFPHEVSNYPLSLYMGQH